MLDNEASGGEAGFHYPLNYSDGLLRLLWLSARIASSVGKTASLKDVFAALVIDHESMQEIARVAPTHGRG